MGRLPDTSRASLNAEQQIVADLITNGPHGKVMGVSLTMEPMEEAGAEPGGVELAHVVF